MIVETMTKTELYKELIADEQWVLERAIGLTTKYNKQLRDKRVRHLAVLGRTWYETPNHNKVYTIAQKYIVDEKGKRSIVSITSLYQYTDNSGITRYIYPLFGFDNYLKLNFVLTFSAHSVSRMKERIGKDIFGVFEDICTKNDTCISIRPYTFKCEYGDYCTVIGDNMAFIRYEPWGPWVTTMITKEQEYLNQLKQQAEIKKDNIELSKKLVDVHTNLCKNNKQFRKFATKSA